MVAILDVIGKLAMLFVIISLLGGLNGGKNVNKY